MGLALKCDETEASRSENTLQNVKNYKITRKCQKKYIFAQTIFTHFLGQYRFCSRATTLSVGLALKCDETEASRSENTLQSIKNYKSLANVKKNRSLHKQFLHTFRDTISKTNLFY